MWRRSYMLLLLVRLYFALSPSYLHPDEVFQGPEIVAGELFDYPSQRTWEWTSQHPIRSHLPLWLVYGIPLTLLKWIWPIGSAEQVSPSAIYYVLRIFMFVLSFVLEDWAIYELVHSPHQRRHAVILVASSYITWSYQSHTFSNSIETLLVAWSLVLVERIASNKQDRSWFLSCLTLSCLVVFGVFNRITFPAFLLIPGLQLIPSLFSRQFLLLALIICTTAFASLAIAVDTIIYHRPASTMSFGALFRTLWQAPIITPLNNLRYNLQTSNLATHGLHARYQHALLNLPQLLGPAIILLFISLQPYSSENVMRALSNPRLLSAVSGMAFLSIFPHQEARFLLPCIPLLLTCVRLPRSERGQKWFWTTWILFNAFFGGLMGVYHQGGIVPAQSWIPKHVSRDQEASSLTYPKLNATVFWWKTYPPPTYLLGTSEFLNITTTSLIGLSADKLGATLSAAVAPSHDQSSPAGSNTMPTSTEQLTYLVAPLSSIQAPLISSPQQLSLQSEPSTRNFMVAEYADLRLNMTLTWFHSNHINLDDLDFATDGVWPTLRRVIGRRGLGIWRVQHLSQQG